MANFGTHFAYPTPDWVAYRKEHEVERASQERAPGHTTPLRRIVHFVRRLAEAWVRAHEYNSYR